jgi:diguanylate cyclase (GGDEF)-like protein/PAS domain S-box-containing protein
MVSQIIGPIIVFLIPSFILAYFSVEVYLRNRTSFMNRVTSVVMLCSMMEYLFQFFIQVFPIEYAPYFARYGVYTFAFGLMSFGMLFFSGLILNINKVKLHYIRLFCLVPAACIPFLFVPNGRLRVDYVQLFMSKSEVRSTEMELLLIGLFIYSFLYTFFLLTTAYQKRGKHEEWLKNKKRIAVMLKGFGVLLVFFIVSIWVIPAVFPGYYNLSSLGMLIWLLSLRVVMIRHDFLPSFERRFQILFELTPMGVILLNSQGRIVEANTAAGKLLGYSVPQLRRLPFTAFLKNEEDQDNLLVPLMQAKEGQTFQSELQLISRTGVEFTVKLDCESVEMEYATVLFMVIRDITEEKRYEERISYLAYRDELTGLHNRSFFNQQVVRTLEDSRPEQNQHALIIIDLDRFKLINDTLGHYAGDELIKYVAGLIRASTRPQDIVARLGGDEFVIFIKDYEDLEDIVQTNERILQSFEPSFMIEDREFEVSGSIGISLYPVDGTDKDTLLKHADIAMYKSKATGRKHYSFFNASMRSHNMEMESTLRSAVKNNEFILHYQPQFRLDDMKLIGFEALIRWNSPIEGLVPPGRFIPLAEESGLIVPLGYWAIEEACLESTRWTKEGRGRNLIISVNISGKQFLLPDFALKLADIVRRTGVDPSTLCLEITESTAINETGFSLYQCRQIQEMGIRIAMDDFGTGFSSLGLLQKFPFHDIKIDRSFTIHIDTNPEQEAIVRAIVSMSHSMGLYVIAEGVETEAQMKKLTELGCNAVQGFLTGRPMPAEQALKLVLDQKLAL